MPYRRRSNRRSSYRSKGRSGMRRRSYATKRRRTSRRSGASYRRRSYGTRRRYSRGSRGGYRQRSVKQRKTMPNKRAYYSSSRASSLSGVVTVNSRELAATVIQPLPTKYMDGNTLKDMTGITTRASLAAFGEGSNYVDMPGTQQYVVPPNPQNIIDESWPGITSDYSADQNYKQSFPNKNSWSCPVYFLDGGKEDGKGDRLYQQAGSIFLNFSVQSGQFSKLSKFGKQYDQYHIDAVRLHYVPTCSTNTDGIFVMTFDSNVTTFPNISKAKMLQQKHCVTGSLFTPLSLTYRNPDKAWKWCTSPAGREAPQGMNANRNPDRFSDSFYAYCRVFDSQRAAQQVGGNGFNVATYGYLYVEYIVRFKTPSNNSTLIADKDDIDMEAMVTITEAEQIAALPAPPIGLAPMGLARSTKVPLTSVSSNDEKEEEISDLEEVDCDDSESCDTCSEDEDEEIAQCLDSLHGAKGKFDREAAWEDLMQAYEKRLGSVPKSEPSPLLNCVKKENALAESSVSVHPIV